MRYYVKEKIKANSDIYDIVNGAGKIIDDKYFETDEIDSLSEEEKTIFCVQSLDGEVNNGGFEQFFLNSSGAHSKETLLALKNIGADYVYSLLGEAIKILEHPNPPGIREDEDDPDFWTDWQVKALHELDYKYYKYQENENELDELQLKYLINNQDKFIIED